MAHSLHRAIHDALRDAPGYEAKGILIGLYLDATRPLDADDTVLYRSVYTIFRATPSRLIDGSRLNISTTDTPEGVELVWEGRERLQERPPEGAGLRALLGSGPHGDLVEIALVALERFCNLRAGHVETTHQRVESSTSFDRPPYVVRRVVAHIPARAPPEGTPAGAAEASPQGPAHGTPAEQTPERSTTFFRPIGAGLMASWDHAPLSMHSAGISRLRDPGVDRHIVQLYTAASARTSAVATWAEGSLREGGGAVFACSETNAAPILARMEANGIDVKAACDEGRLAVLDGRALLARFMIDGAPDGARFKSIASDAISGVRAACAPGAPVRAWGEMVDLLCKDGNPEGARRLEALWNEVIDSEDIRLLCSYELDALDPASHDGPFEHACAGHSLFIPQEDPSQLEAALSRALVEAYGEERAPLVRNELASQRAYTTRMPPASALLARAYTRDKASGARLMSLVRRELS